MKKILFMTVAIVAMSISTVSAQSAMILLQHNGSAKMYTAEQLPAAINAAVAGDTIYLNKGNFGSSSATYTIDKAITIIGAGGSNTATNFRGHLKIAINGSPILTSTFLEGVYLDGTISVAEPVSGLRIKRSSFGTITFSALTENLQIEQCLIYTINSGGNYGFVGNDTYLKSGTVINSKVGQTYLACSNVTFVNCNIYRLNHYSQYFAGTAINCIINETYSGGNYIGNPQIINCLYYSNIYNAEYTNCYKSSSQLLNSSTYDCTLNKNTLLSNNYLGNDGTVVGIEGGTIPFTLVPSGPQVESSTIKVDVPGQKLNISLKVKAN